MQGLPRNSVGGRVVIGKSEARRIVQEEESTALQRIQIDPTDAAPSLATVR
jgi:hypothetical protein